MFLANERVNGTFAQGGGEHKQERALSRQRERETETEKGITHCIEGIGIKTI